MRLLSQIVFFLTAIVGTVGVIILFTIAEILFTSLIVWFLWNHGCVPLFGANHADFWPLTCVITLVVLVIKWLKS